MNFTLFSSSHIRLLQMKTNFYDFPIRGILPLPVIRLSKLLSLRYCFFSILAIGNIIYPSVNLKFGAIRTISDQYLTKRDSMEDKVIMMEKIPSVGKR